MNREERKKELTELATRVAALIAEFKSTAGNDLLVINIAEAKFRQAFMTMDLAVKQMTTA